MNKKKNKKKVHVTYNQKAFLAPDSITSMAVIHTKIKSDGEAQIRISDCNSTIKLWNDMNDKKQSQEMIQKIETIIRTLNKFKFEVANKYGWEQIKELI